MYSVTGASSAVSRRVIPSRTFVQRSSIGRRRTYAVVYWFARGSTCITDGCSGKCLICYTQRWSSEGGCSLTFRRGCIEHNGSLEKKTSGWSVRRPRYPVAAASPLRRTFHIFKVYREQVPCLVIGTMCTIPAFPTFLVRNMVMYIYI